MRVTGGQVTWKSRRNALSSSKHARKILELKYENAILRAQIYGLKTVISLLDHSAKYEVSAEIVEDGSIDPFSGGLDVFDRTCSLGLEKETCGKHTPLPI